MAGITWLHLSDWHQQGQDFDRIVIRDKLIEDIRDRESINPDLAKIDFLVFSGDIAFSGRAEEYQAAIEFLFDPLLAALKLEPNRIFIVPGNHDLDQKKFRSLPDDLKLPISKESGIQDWLRMENRKYLLLPFSAYEQFASEYTEQDHPAYASTRTLIIDDKSIGLLGLNSALISGRTVDSKGAKNEFGNLIVGVPQIYEGMQKIARTDIRIAVLHHPFDWLAEFERDSIEYQLIRDCHFIHHGHQHKPIIRVEKIEEGVIIPAGASYNRNIPQNAQYISSYNFVHFDFETSIGTVYQQRWSDRGSRWVVGAQDSYPIREPKKSETVEQKDVGNQAQTVDIAVRALADNPSEEDLLGFKDYTKALVDFIENENTVKPLTIVIDAPWGMGKSTLMGLIKKELKDRAKKRKRRSFPTVWFNAWKYDQESSLWAALALEILGQVRKQFNVWRRFMLTANLTMKRLDKNIIFSALFKTVPYIIGLILIVGIFLLIAWIWLGSTFLDTIQKYLTSIGILGAITIAYAFVKDIYSKIKPLEQKISKYVHAPNSYIRAPNYKEKIGFLAEFEEDFKLVVAAVTKKGKWPLVIFIDDLDRCAPPKPVEIIEAINILLDSEYCVFVIGMDAQTVAGSIEAKYKDLKDYLKDVDDPGGLTLGERFLEKIVQINFHIPRSDSDVVREFIKESLKVKSDPVKKGPSKLSAFIHRLFLLFKVKPDTPGEKVRETEELIKAQQRAGKPLNEAAEAVQVARPDISAELVEQAKQTVFAETFDDSEDVKSAIHEAAFYLGFNPRKIKRFINVFRLQALIVNRRGLLKPKTMKPGTIQLHLLAKWITIVTRWPSLVEAMLVDQNFVKSLKEAYLASEEISQSNVTFLASAKGKKLQAKYDRDLANPHIKRLIEAKDLMNLLKQMPDTEIEALPQYLRLTESTISTGVVGEPSK